MQASKQIKQGKVEIDYDDCALIVHYEIETVYRDANGWPVEVNRDENVKADSKRIKLRNLAAESNLAQLAADIVAKCKYIHHSRAEEIEQLLIRLKKHVITNPPKETNNAVVENNAAGTTNRDRDGRDKDSRQKDGRDKNDRRDRGDREKDRDRERGDARDNNNKDRGDRQVEEERDPYPDAHISELDNYMEMLYQVSGRSDKEREESQRLQVRGTAMILKLCKEVMLLEQLIQNSTVMGALTRMLQDEFKKSTELTFNILRIFLAFSNFVEMHKLMSDYRIGLLTMKAIEYEIKRSELREADLKEKEQALDHDIKELKANKANLDPAEVQQQLDKLKRQRDKDALNAKRTQRKQDKLLFVAFYILLNLAEDITVEKKMVKRNLVESLSSMLDRSYGDLLILAVTFLKKLALFEENKDTMKSINIVNKLSRFIPCSSQQLVTSTLRLLFNLSFDSDIREQVMRCGMVPKLITLLKTPAFRARTLKLLYHLSVDDRCKSMFTYTDGIPLVMGMIVNFPQPVLARELAALSLNLSLNPRNAELMVANKGLNHLMDRLSTTRDVLLLKIIRNLSLWTFNLQKENEAAYKYRSLWAPHFKVLIEIIRSSVDNHDILIEAIGTLANMTSLDIPANTSWAKLLRDNQLVSIFQRLMVNGMAQNDLILEVIMVIGAAASDPQACELIASTNQMISLLARVWEDKVDDVEIVLQVLHCLYKLLLQESSREEVMYSSERIVSRIIDALAHRNAAVRAVADVAVELILECDRQVNGDLGLLGIQIRKKRYESYNMVWLQEVGGFNPQGATSSSSSSSSAAQGYGLQQGNNNAAALNLSNMSMMTHGAGNLYGPHGAISHMLDDGDSMISVRPSTMMDDSKMDDQQEWSPRMAAAIREDEVIHGGGIESYERYQKEYHGNKIVNDEDLLDDEDNAFLVKSAYHNSRNGHHLEDEMIIKQSHSNAYNSNINGVGTNSSAYRQKAVTHAVGSDEDDSHEFGDSFGHDWRS